MHPDNSGIHTRPNHWLSGFLPSDSLNVYEHRNSRLENTAHVLHLKKIYKHSLSREFLKFETLKKSIGKHFKENRLIEEWAMGGYVHNISYKNAVYLCFVLPYTHKINCFARTWNRWSYYFQTVRYWRDTKYGTALSKVGKIDSVIVIFFSTCVALTLRIQENCMSYFRVQLLVLMGFMKNLWLNPIGNREISVFSGPQ